MILIVNTLFRTFINLYLGIQKKHTTKYEYICDYNYRHYY